MARTFLPGGFLALGLSLLAAAADLPNPGPTFTFDAAIEQLGHPDFRQRDLAADKLQAAGLASLPALRKAKNHADPEVRRRVAELVPTIETASLLSPRRVTVKADKKTLRQVLDEVTRQTGFKIEHWANNAAQVYSFDLADMPFWEALDAICRDTGMVLQQGYGDNQLRLQQQDAHVSHVRYDGPFRFTANGIQHYRNIDFGLVGRGAPLTRRTENLTFTFSVFVEPRLPLLGMGEPKLSAAFDSEKNSMLPPLNATSDTDAMLLGGGRMVRTSRYGNGYRTHHMQAQVNLHRPSEKASAIRVLRGTVPVTLLAEQKPVVVCDDILTAKGKKASIGPTTFLIEDVSEQPNKQYQIKLSIAEDNKENPNDYTWMNALYQRIELQDDKGNKFQVFGSNWGNSGANHAQLTMTYGAPANIKVEKPTKFIYYSWTTLQHQAAFEFKDLPLP